MIAKLVWKKVRVWALSLLVLASIAASWQFRLTGLALYGRYLGGDWRYQVVDRIESMTQFAYVIDIKRITMDDTDGPASVLHVWIYYDYEAVEALFPDVSSGEMSLIQEEKLTAAIKAAALGVCELEADYCIVTAAYVVDASNFTCDGYKAVEGVSIAGPVTDMLAFAMDDSVQGFNDIMAAQDTGAIEVYSPSYFPPEELISLVPRPFWKEPPWEK